MLTRLRSSSKWKKAVQLLDNFGRTQDAYTAVGWSWKLAKWLFFVSGYIGFPGVVLTVLLAALGLVGAIAPVVALTSVVFGLMATWVFARRAMRDANQAIAEAGRLLPRSVSVRGEQATSTAIALAGHSVTGSPADAKLRSDPAEIDRVLLGVTPFPPMITMKIVAVRVEPVAQSQSTLTFKTTLRNRQHKTSWGKHSGRTIKAIRLVDPQGPGAWRVANLPIDFDLPAGGKIMIHAVEGHMALIEGHGIGHGRPDDGIEIVLMYYYEDEVVS